MQDHGVLQPDGCINEAFSHAALDTSGDNIRVLRIRPGKHLATFSCKMIHVPIKKTKYTCLSYVWGSSPADHTIFVNDRLFAIRKNLYDYLERVQRSRSRRWLWVDAICIDQGNIKERNHQVALMAKIYNNAESVDIWLGTGHQDIWLFLDLIKTSTLPHDLVAGFKHLAGLEHWRRL